jgi:hypothetical protein
MSDVDKTPENIIYLASQIEKFENVPYFLNLKKTSVETFLLEIYNYSNLLKEHLLHLAVAITKVPSDKCVKSLIRSLYLNGCNDDANIVDEFKVFLSQFKYDPLYSADNYYYKYALTLPYDKICNEICDILLTQPWQFVVATLATIEFLFITINKKFNDYAQRIKDEHRKILSLSEESALLLFLLLDNEDENMVRNAIDKTISMFMVLFLDIDNIFNEDLLQTF